MEVNTEAERARICETLVNAAGLEGLWSWVALEEAIRPVFAGDEPRPSYRDYAAPWSSGQARMVALAWSVWNGGVAISFDDLLFGLDARLRALVAELLLTESSSAWLDRFRPSWRQELIRHVTLGQWSADDDEAGGEPRWLARGEFATAEAARAAAEDLTGRIRLQLVSGRVEGPRAVEILEERTA